MKGRILLLCLLLFASLRAQVAPAWSTAVQNYVSGSCTNDGGFFLTGGLPITVNNCSSTYTYAALLASGGAINWEQAYDTTDCEIEGAYLCATINTTPQCYAISTTSTNTLDTGRILLYNTNGILLADSIWEWTNSGGVNSPIPGNMGDRFGYYSEATSLFKMDTLGHIHWEYVSNDSISRIKVLFDSIRHIILISSVDVRNTANYSTQFTGLDTAGNVLFDVNRNFYSGQYESPLGTWFGSDDKLYGFMDGYSQDYSAFGMDTAGNLLWQLPIPNYSYGTYDSVTNALHFTAQITSQTRRCYRIDCFTGQITDSITIDSCVFNYPIVKVDKYGNVFLCYMLANAAIPTHRIEQYTPEYTFNWRGVYQNSQAQLIYDFFINDSCSVFLAGDQVSGSMISKFNPPILDNVQEQSDQALCLTIFPNPATEILNFSLSLSHTTDLTYRIMNITGDVVSAGNAKSNQTNYIDVHALAPSAYLIIVSDIYGNILSSQKIIKY